MQQLTTERRNPATRDIDLASTQEVLAAIHDQDRTVADAVRAQIPNLAIIVDRVVAAFRQGGRLLYVGAGTSGRLGVLDAAECPPTFGTPSGMVTGLIAGGYETLVRSKEGVEDVASAGATAVDDASVGPHDVVVGISASRRTPYVRGALARAREREAWTAFLVCNELDEDHAAVADQVVEVVVGPEAIAGSTRMKSGLAQKMMLTMISTAAMVGIGKTYENLMVDVAPTSQKLMERAKGLVMALTGCEYEDASRMLDQTDYAVKPAVLMLKLGIDRAQADARLERAEGRLRKALS